VTDARSPRTSATAPPSADSLPLVIGLGTEHRGDDACGLEVVRELRRTLDGAARLAEGPGDVAALLDLWEGAGTVYVVDAVRSGRPPGTVVRFEVPGASPPLVGTTSTHGLSLAEAIGLGRALGRFPHRLVVYGIEAAEVGMGADLSSAGANGVREAADLLVREIRSGVRPPPEGRS
jgi:hydrogenase maturation protease